MSSSSGARTGLELYTDDEAALVVVLSGYSQTRYSCSAGRSRSIMNSQLSPTFKLLSLCLYTNTSLSLPSNSGNRAVTDFDELNLRDTGFCCDSTSPVQPAKLL